MTRDLGAALKSAWDGAGSAKEVVFPKIDYAQVAHGKLRLFEQPVDFVLWEFISPGGTAVFMLLTAASYAWQASRPRDAEEKKALRATARAFLLWGVFNAACYAALAWRHKLRKGAVA